MARGPVTKNVAARTLGFLQIRIGKSAANIGINTPVLNAANSIGALASTKISNTREFYKFQSGTPKNVDGQEVMSNVATLECAFLEHTPFNYALALGIDPLSDVDATIAAGNINSSAGTTTGELAVDQLGGVINERWTVVFTSATEGSIFGEVVGKVHDFSGLTSAIEPTNTGESQDYFSIPASFFSGTWAAGDTFTFWTTKKESGTSLYSAADSGAVALGGGGQPDYIRVEARLEFADGHYMAVIMPRAQSTSGIDATQAEQESNVPIVFEASQAHDEVTGGNAAWNLDHSAGVGPLGRIYFAT